MIEKYKRASVCTMEEQPRNIDFVVLGTDTGHEWRAMDFPIGQEKYTDEISSGSRSGLITTPCLA